MNASQRVFPPSFRKVSIQLDKLYLKAKFNCKLKALLETNSEKRPSKIVSFSMSRGEANFSQSIILHSNPNKKEFLKITTLIVQDKTTKMVGLVHIELGNDQVKNSGNSKYELKNCPMKNVKLKFEYNIVEGQKETGSGRMNPLRNSRYFWKSINIIFL